MDSLEKYFEKNRTAFDTEEPSSGHFARFTDKLDAEFGREEVRSSNRFVLMRIAAGFMILVAFSFFFYDFVRNRAHASTGTAFANDLQEAVNYYDNAAASRLDTIRNLACCGKEKEQIYTIASGELKNLDANTVELKAALKANPGNERIEAAIIRNQQMKEKIMNDMIGQLSKVRK